MHSLIVYAHPEPASFNAALRDAAIQTLRSYGEVGVSDLYLQGFNPVAGPGDFTRPVNPERLGYVHEQRHAAAARAYSADILAEQDKVARADLIVFQFPLWWYAPPAILKGWADRVLSYGFAYTDEAQFECGLLRGKRALLSITTGGSEAELRTDERHTGTVEQFLRPFGGGVLAFTGMTVLPQHIVYAAGSLGEASRRARLRAWQGHLRTLAA